MLVIAERKNICCCDCLELTVNYVIFCFVSKLMHLGFLWIVFSMKYLLENASLPQLKIHISYFFILNLEILACKKKKVSKNFWHTGSNERRNCLLM